MNLKYSKWLLLLLEHSRWPDDDPWLIKKKKKERNETAFQKKGIELCEIIIAFQAFHLSAIKIKYPVI